MTTYSNGPLLQRLFGILFASLLLATTWSADAQNLIVNPGFEANPPPNFGNNFPYPITPWVVGPGNAPNVVKVNGTYNYGTFGPWLDANPATGVGVVQHYLDIANGANDFYQAFTVPACGGAIPGETRQANFSGWFSTRDNRSGRGSITIRQGAGLTGTVLATASANLPAPAPPLTSATAPWVQVSGTVSVPSGTVVSFVVAMDNDINFDDAFLNFSTSACATTELTLQKSWVTASVGDTATVTVARGGIQIGSLASTANTHTEIDTIGTPIVVYEGEVLELGETLGAANVSTYGTTFACAGGGSLIGSQLTVGTTPAPIVCTVTNTGPAADLSIAKSVLPGSAPSGQNVEYTLLVTNLGPDPVTGATVTDAPGAGLTCPAAGQPDVSCASTATPSACPGGTQTVSQLQGAGITLGTLQPTDTVTLTYRCTIN